MDNDEEHFIAQIEVIQELTERVGEALSYLDWLSSITSETEAPYIEQLIKILDGEVEH